MAINFIPKGWWPWKKKNNSIYNGSMFGGFGSSTVAWNQIYKAQQDNSLLIDYFNNVAEVAAPVLKYSDGAGQITIEATINDKPIEDAQKLLNNPNYYQGWNEYFSLLILYKRLFGESITNLLTTNVMDSEFNTSLKPKALYLLSPEFTSIELTKKDKRDFRDNDIQSYIFDTEENNTTALQIDPEFILHLKESNPNMLNNQYLFGESRYAGCSKNIQSIISGYSAKVNLYDNGPRLIITGKSQGEFASMSNSEDIEEIQKRFKKYGWGEDKYNNFLTNVPLDVTNASLNVAQLQLNENNKSDFDRLCDAQGMDSKIFSKEAKFEDKQSALKDFYNNSFRSEIDGTVKDIESKLQEYWPGLELKANYSQISEIVEANNEENQRLLADTEKGLMTRNEYLESIGKELRTDNPDFDKLFVYNNSTWTSIEPVIDEGDTLAGSGVSQEQLEAQANLRGSVGGVQGILAIQASVQAGTTDYSAAIITLIEIYGFDDKTARAILGTPGLNNIQDGTENIQAVQE